MNSRKGGGNNTYMGTAAAGSYSPKGKNIEGSTSGPNIEQLSRDMAGVNVDPTQEGEWEEIRKKSKNRSGAGAATGKIMGSSTPASRAGGQLGGLPRRGCGTNGGAGRASGHSAQAADFRRPAGRGYSKPQPAPRTRESAYTAPKRPGPAVAPPLQDGWQWEARSGSSGSQAKDDVNNSNLPQDGSVDGYDSESDMAHNQPDDDNSDDEELPEDTDDDLSDDYDSDVSQKSHETQKKSKLFKGFFEALDKLTVDEINESTRQWHCPACQNGPGAIDCFTGLQPLITHAKTKVAKRAMIHRGLAKLLDEELRRRGSSVIPPGEAFGKWRGLLETTTDREIVWPPVVVVMNTRLEQDENDKWKGMGSPELLEYFSQYETRKACHSYGPQGHRGMSLLIFEPTAMGYLEAERLHKHFQEQGTDKDAWERGCVLFCPGGKRQLYGYLASKEDMEAFNRHCNGKSRLKYELKSYQEMVVNPMKQMGEDNQQLTYLKHKVVKHEQHSKVLEETFEVVSQKLRETIEENRIVRLRTKKQYEENKEEMEYQEQFFKDQMAKVQKDIEEIKEKYQILLQQDRAKAKQSVEHSGSNEESRFRNKEIQRFIDSQVKGLKEFEEEIEKLIHEHEEKREKLIHEHEEKKAELKRKYMEEEVELEKTFDASLTKLKEKYSPSSFKTSSSA